MHTRFIFKRSPMRRSHDLADILQNNRHFCLIPTSSKFGCDQRFGQLCTARNPNWSSVQECTTTTTCSETLLQDWIINDGQFRLFANQKCNRNARLRKTMYKVHCAIYWVYNPRWRIGQFENSSFGGLLFADKAGVVTIIYIYISVQT